MPYLTGLLWQNGMCCVILVVLFQDDFNLGDAPMGPSLVSCYEHTNPEVYLCQAVHASLHGLVLCFGCGSLSHLLCILPACILVVSEEPLSEVAVCVAYVPSSAIWYELTILFILLVLLPYVLEGLVMFLVPDHPEIFSGIS